MPKEKKKAKKVAAKRTAQKPENVVKKKVKKSKKKPGPRKGKGGRQRIRRPDVFALFVSWMALPLPLREPKTQQEFALTNKVSPQALCDWKNRSDFWRGVNEQSTCWAREKTGTIIAKHYQGIINTKSGVLVDAIRLWYEAFGDLKQKIELTGNLPRLNSLGNLSDAELDALISKKARVLKAMKGI